MEALFVQTAASMTSDRGTITLHGLSPSTLEATAGAIVSEGVARKR